MELIYSAEVKKALATNSPVVALESTIITHGMPFPKNVEIALGVEKIIREQGAIPATIAIIEGKVHVGLTEKELWELGQKTDAIKTSRRDLPYVIAMNKWGGTTVAGTMIIAHEAGIKVFVTGGIGGVHHNGQHTFDISADLEELAKTPVAVICAGPKAFLDLDLTMEYLETKGVPIIGYKTDKMPLFFTMSPTMKVENHVDEISELAKIVKTHIDLKLHNGLLIVNPIPPHKAIEYNKIMKAINQANKEAELKGIKGKEETPFILKAINDITKGESLDANEALVKNNAMLGARLAIELAKVK